MKNKRSVLFIILSTCFATFCPQILATKKNVVISVLIHGAIAPGAILFSPIGLVKQKLNEHTWYGKIAQELRDDKRLRQDWPMLEEGMVEVSVEILQKYHHQTLEPEHGKIAAYQLAGAYDHLQQSLNHHSKETTYRYFFYGHSGLLDENSRKKSGMDLYEKLIALRDQYIKNETNITINLIGHSHGGTVGLYCALGELQHKKELSIAHLVLLGMPLQKEQAYLLDHPMFEHILNIYSHGDKMQKRDYFSTTSHKSYAKLQDVLGNKKTGRYDIQLFVEDDSRAISHHELWLLGKYFGTHIGRKKEKIASVFKLISPLPIAAFCPIFIKIIDDHHALKKSTNISPLYANFFKDQNDLKLELNAVPLVITDEASYVTQRARNLWEPYAICSELYKHKLTLLAALHTLVRKRKK